MFEFGSRLFSRVVDFMWVSCHFLSFWPPLLMFVVPLLSTLKFWLWKGVIYIKILLSSLCSLMYNPWKIKIKQCEFKKLLKAFPPPSFLQFSGTNISSTLEWHHNSMTWKSELRGGNEYMWIIKCSRNESTVFSLYKIHSNNIDALVVIWHDVKMTMTVDVRVASVWHWWLTQLSTIKELQLL